MLSIPDYLRRIDYSGSLEPTRQTLQSLHEAHLYAVPFENLNIPLGRKIVLDEAALYHKIVEQRRGGFCYELNGLFSRLLCQLGFNVALLSAGVARPNGDFGPEFDHLTLLVHLEEPWLADVGFGDSFLRPLKLQEALEQVQDDRLYRLIREGRYFVLQQHHNDEAWENQYRFTLQPRQFSDFTQMCHYHQTSPNSSFTQRRICTSATPSGRITLSDMRLIITERGERQDRALEDQEEYDEALRKYFGIDLSSH